MRKFSIIFQNRDFSSALDLHNVRFVVNSYSHEAIGGPKEASITVFGGELALEDTLNWLRRPVTIYDERGNAVWWGYVHQVQMRRDALEVAPSLDSMVNRVAVVYSFVEAGSQLVGQRKTTAWASDSDSQAEYGVKELLSSTDGASDAAALARRNAVLAGQAWPYGGLSQFGSPRGAVRYSGAKKSASGTLICRGWWETLAWKYASVALTGAIQNRPTSTDYTLKNSTDALHQQITPTVSVNATRIDFALKKTGTPADNLVVGIYATDGSGNPTGSALASGTIAASGTTGSYAEYAWTLGSAINLARGSVYSIRLNRSGATDASNYLTVGVDAGLNYTGGVMRVSTNSGGTWAARSPDADLYFIIYEDNQVDSTVQIADLVYQYGQFLTATDIEAASGVLLPSYQNGDKTALAVILELLAAGGANGRRLLAGVGADRRVQVWEEPATSSAAHYMNSRGQMFGPGGILVDERQPVVGVWARLKDVLSGVVDLTKIQDPSLQFVEGVGWSADGGAQYRFRGKPSVESLLMVGQARPWGYEY